MEREQSNTLIERNQTSPVVEIEFDWMLTNDCNFECSYCHPNVSINKNRPANNALTSSEIADAFLSIGRNFHLLMSGGEPLLFPQFSEFCKKITDHENTISINTNLSIRDKVKRFSELIAPQKVDHINAALHKIERERLGYCAEDFAKDVVLLQQKGFNIQVFYVLYPPLLDSFEEDTLYLKSLGVEKVAGKIFKGPFEGKIYPMGYSQQDREKILSYKNNSYPVTIDYLENRQYHFKGKLCSAGINFFKVDIDGDVYRCPSNRRHFGNIYEQTFKPDIEIRPCHTTRVMSVSQCNRFAIRKKNI